MPGIKNALSLDIEDWYQGILQIDQSNWHNYESRLIQNVEKILALLSSARAKATFFILGYVAEKYPKLVSRIAQAGHEIASHGYSHRLVYAQTQDEFYDDVLRSKNIIESITKTKIKGYRAPFFSIRKDCLWALDILVDLGFEYDSSIFPVKNFLYGIPDAPRRIYKAGNKGIWEFPLSVLNIFGFRLPICGGFYLRALPYFITKLGLKYINKKMIPAIIYMHPWEIDVGKPKISMKLKWRMIHNYNINGMEDKFKQLVKDFYFTSIEEVLFGGRG